MKIINKTPHKIILINEENKAICEFLPEGEPIRLTQEVKSIGITFYEKCFNECPMHCNDTLIFPTATKCPWCGAEKIIPVPLTKTNYGSTDLPEEKKDVYYIVSALVKNAFPERKDLLIPNEIVRDEHYNVLGCRSLSI